MLRIVADPIGQMLYLPPKIRRQIQITKRLFHILSISDGRVFVKGEGEEIPEPKSRDRGG